MIRGGHVKVAVLGVCYLPPLRGGLALIIVIGDGGQRDG